MRSATLVAVLLGLGASTAGAETFKPPIVWQNRVIEATPPKDGVTALTSVSRKLYLNDCMPNGCTVSPGTDNSLTNRSSIPETTVTLSAYNHGAAHWNQLVACVKETFAPFTIEVVTTDPGATVPHFEVMIGGSDTQLHPQLSAGGVAPYVSCNAQRSNGLSFVFPQSTANLNFLCGAVVQEAMHVWGLDHELNAKDPMTYLELGSLKRFQNSDTDCGENLGQPRNCRCQGQSGVAGSARKQNSYRYMINTFGLNPNLAEPTVEITSPKEGAWVKAGFAVTATATSPLELLSAEVKVDTTVAGTTQKTPISVNAPMSLTQGAHQVAVTAMDAGERTATAMVNVNVMQSCAAGESCASGTHCLGGVCQPGSGTEGGLGDTCTSNESCITGTCGSTLDGESKCTSVCDAGLVCPDGFECLEDGAAGQCWPKESGGCSTNGSPGFLVIGLGVLLVAMRRRRR